MQWGPGQAEWEMWGGNETCWLLAEQEGWGGSTDCPGNEVWAVRPQPVLAAWRWASAHVPNTFVELPKTRMCWAEQNSELSFEGIENPFQPSSATRAAPPAAPRTITASLWGELHHFQSLLTKMLLLTLCKLGLFQEKETQQWQGWCGAASGAVLGSISLGPHKACLTILSLSPSNRIEVTWLLWKLWDTGTLPRLMRQLEVVRGSWCTSPSFPDVLVLEGWPGTRDRDRDVTYSSSSCSKCTGFTANTQPGVKSHLLLKSRLFFPWARMTQGKL